MQFRKFVENQTKGKIKDNEVCQTNIEKYNIFEINKKQGNTMFDKTSDTPVFNY